MTAGQILRKLWELVAERKVEEAIGLLDPDGKFWSPPIGYIPMEALIYMMREVQGIAPLTFAVRSVMEEGDRAMIEMQGHGVFPGGEVYENNYVYIADIRDGVIYELREYDNYIYSSGVFERNLPPEVRKTFADVVAKANAA